jgi:hypothetical protein
MSIHIFLFIFVMIYIKYFMNYTLHQLRFLKITQTKSITRAAEVHPHATCSFYSTTKFSRSVEIHLRKSSVSNCM